MCLMSVSRYVIKAEQWKKLNFKHTSTGIVSPGKTKIVSPIRISSVGTSMLIASALKKLSDVGFSSGDEIINRDWEETNDCKEVIKFVKNTIFSERLMITFFLYIDRIKS